MRRRFAVPLIAAIGIAPWLWFHPAPAPDGLPAQLVSTVKVPRIGDWVGGLSGLDLSADGTQFHMVTDRGHRLTGELARKNGALTAVKILDHQPVRDDKGATVFFPDTDAEGVAMDGAGRVFVSFEHAHRVLAYDTWDAPARWPSYTDAWRTLSNNEGLEALAVDAEGTLYTLPERINLGATDVLVYRRKPGGDWVQPFTLPVQSNLAPVGADFGPDGRFYVLERGHYPFGFYSRVRSMSVSENGFSNIETVLRSQLFDHGNLEGLAVWRDGDGVTRLKMVSDDNFLPFMRGEIVEYVLSDRVANRQK